MKCTINDIANVISESIPNPAESGYDIFVGLEHYDSGEVKITRYGSTDSLVTAVKVFKKGDILLARRNVYLKRAGLVDFDGVTSGDSIVLRVKPDLSKLGTSSSSVQKYLPFVLNTEEFWNYAEKYSDGTMSKRLSPKTLLQYEFEIPDDVDNRNDLLWSAFETKESYRTMIKAIDEMVKSQFIEQFSDERWPLKSISELCDIVTDGEHQTPRRVDSGIYLLSARNVKNQELSFDEVDYIDEQEYQRIAKRIEPQENDVLISCSGSVGRTCVVPKGIRFQLVRSVALLRFKPVVDPLFMSYQMAMPYVQSQIETLKSQTSQANLFQGNIKKIQVIVPSKEEQKQFIIVVRQADKSKYLN